MAVCLVIQVVSLLVLHTIGIVLCASSIESEHNSMNINMPDVSPLVHDSYICTAKQLPPLESYIIQYEPDADGRRAHHMLLFGCKNLHSQSHLYPGYWNCGGDLCSQMTLMYGWAKNAPALKLPPKVGFMVGGNGTIKYLVLQIHYAQPFPKGTTDNSGLKLMMTTERQPYVTGIHLLVANVAQIPPHMPKYHVDVNCKFQGRTPVHIFGYRVHTHDLGTVVSGYTYNLRNNSWTLLAKGNPQWPQAFYPTNRIETVGVSDIMAARCTYNSSNMAVNVHIGSSSNDEMCNLYLMYYTDNKSNMLVSPCVGVEFKELIREMPPESDELLPSNAALNNAFSVSGHSKATGYSSTQAESLSSHNSNVQAGSVHKNSSLHFRPTLVDESSFTPELFKFATVPDWPAQKIHFGQISAVAVDNKGNIVVFHRGEHVWNEVSFDHYNNYLQADKGPIAVPTVMTLNSVSGVVLNQWGNNLFYMPHGLHVDFNGHYWTTDVALHQVFCFLESDFKKPHMILGKRFVPGHDRKHFCKPTSVSVSKNGEFYVADGYCNSRIIRFSSNGEFLNQWGKASNYLDSHPPVGTFQIPHKVVILEDKGLVCVADRENGRIQCFEMPNGSFRFQIQREEFGGTVFSIAYAPANGLLVAVSGEAILNDHPVKAFVFNMTDQKLLNMLSPGVGTFTRPHDIAISSDGKEVYVCEIGPNVLWKFVREVHISQPIALTTVLPNGQLFPLHVRKPLMSSQNQANSTKFETSAVIMSLIGIPVLLLILITAIIRLRKRGKLQSFTFGHLKGYLGGYRTPHPQEKFNLGTFLNPHRGFDRVSVEESDADEDGNESDMDELNSMTNKA